MQMAMARRLEAGWYAARPQRWVLLPLELLYRLALRVRRVCYRLCVFKTTKLPAVVVVVGNITVGGTGKTPCVIWVVNQLKARDFRVGILSRGYRGRSSVWPRLVDPRSDPNEVGDEPVLLALATGCPVAVGPDRVAAGRMLLAERPVDILVSDDGLQHYALHRDLEIAVVDGSRGLGNGACLPAGPLREPAQRLESVDAVIVNGGSWGDTTVFRAALRPRRVYRLTGADERKLDDFRGTLVHAVAGIGNPERFFELLKSAQIRVIPHAFPDHARYSRSDFDFGDSHPILMTEKDAVKCRAFADDRLWTVAVMMEFSGDAGDRLMRRLLRDL